MESTRKPAKSTFFFLLFFFPEGVVGASFASGVGPICLGPSSRTRLQKQRHEIASEVSPRTLGVPLGTLGVSIGIFYAVWVLISTCSAVVLVPHAKNQQIHPKTPPPPAKKRGLGPLRAKRAGAQGSPALFLAAGYAFLDGFVEFWRVGGSYFLIWDVFFPKLRLRRGVLTCLL